MIDTTALESQLTELVRAVPGVTTLFRSTPFVANIVAAAVELVAPAHASAPRVLVSGSAHDSTLSVTATIGVADAQSAPITCAAVHSSIEDTLLDAGFARPFVIRVTVAYVASEPV